MIDLEDVIGSHGDDDPARFIAIADHFLRIEDRPAAAAALDRAYGITPHDPDLARHRAAILDELALHEHGLVWRYIPAGTFLMGSDHGDPDERPVHPRRLPAFWITDVPLTWASFSAAARWQPPPNVRSNFKDLDREMQFRARLRHKIRLQYCENETQAARDWHAHAGMQGMTVPRADAAAPNAYDTKPMIATDVDEAEFVTKMMITHHPTTDRMLYALPSEAQWEKAARGGLVGKRYAWGDEPPTPARCDCDRMGDFRLGDPRALPPNGYGIYGMCGGVSELTADVYDALAYRKPPAEPIVERDRPPEVVLRGGSWADCATAVTVSYRSSREFGLAPTPTIGMRLVRVER